MKYHAIQITLILLVLTFCFFGCDKSDDDNDDKSDNKQDDDDDDNDNDDNDTTDDDDDDQPPVETFHSNLDFEIIGKAQIDITRIENNLTSTFKAESGYDIISEGTQLSGEGVVRKFDGGFTMYALKFDGNEKPDSPCGNAKISYSVTLTVKESNEYVSGGLTAYCGEKVFTGLPARVYRLSGHLKKVE